MLGEKMAKKEKKKEAPKRIRLVRDVPAHRERGLLAGEEFEVSREPEPQRHYPRWFVYDRLGKESGIMYYEAEVITEED